MARRITFAKLVGAIKKDIPRLQDVDFAAELVADMITKVWNAQDFRETLGQLPPFFLTGGVQDYGAPVFTVPADFQGLRSATLKQLSYSGDKVSVVSYPLIVKTRQPPSVDYGSRPSVISFEPSENSFRIHPVLPEGTDNITWLVEGVYKKIPQTNLYDVTNVIGTPILTSDITPSNYPQLLLPLDDRHYETMKDIAVMLAKKLARGLDGDSIQTEQYIDSKIKKIAIAEGLDIGSSNITPMDPLMQGFGNFSPLL